MALIKVYPDGFTLREVKAEDKQEIVTSFDVYDGLDYVEYMFDHFMENPKIFCYVGELHNKIVCFTYLFLVDDDKTVVTGGKRTLADYRGKGFYRRFETPVLAFFKSNYGYELTWRYTGPWPEEKGRVDKLLAEGRLISVVKRNFRPYCTNMHTLKQHIRTTLQEPLLAKYGVTTTKARATALLPDVLLSENIKKHIFPEETIIVRWVPYKTCVSNFKYVSDTTAWVLTKDDRPCVEQVEASILAVSFLSETPCKAGLRFGIEVYTNTSLSSEVQTQLTCHHVIQGLRHLAGLCYYSDDIELHIVIYFPLSVNEKDIEGCIKESFGWNFGPWAYTKQYIACEYKHS